MFVSELRAKKLEELVKSQGWGPREKTLANGVLQLLSDRKELMQRMRKAILVSESETDRLKNIVQDMIDILDQDDTLFEGWSEEKVDALRAKVNGP
jgi:hypothetical protein